MSRARALQRATWGGGALGMGMGMLVGITIGSYYVQICQENVLQMDKPIRWEVSVAAAADCPTAVTSNSTEHLMAEYDGIIGNSELQENDPRLLSYIRKFHLIPVSARPELLRANDTKMNNPSQFGGDIMQIFSKKKNGGFFIEAGANDGEFLSNTLQLEREYNWTGLLIEPSPFMLPKLLLKNRKAWVANVCLSLEGYPQKVRFMHRLQRDNEIEAWTNGEGFIEHSASTPGQRNPKDYVYAGPVDCFPLYPLLLALNQTVVDYFSMDMEGVEFKILKSIPFHLLTIKVFSIESDKIPEGRAEMKKFLEFKGYRFIFEKQGVESFFFHEDFVQEFNIPLKK